MANATILKSEMCFIHSGQRGFKLLKLTIQWPTTNATCTVPVPGLTQVDGVQMTPIGTPASDEEASWNDTLVGGVVAMSASNPVINLTRTGAAKTNNLQASVWVSGR